MRQVVTFLQVPQHAQEPAQPLGQGGTCWGGTVRPQHPPRRGHPTTTVPPNTLRMCPNQSIPNGVPGIPPTPLLPSPLGPFWASSGSSSSQYFSLGEAIGRSSAGGRRVQGGAEGLPQGGVSPEGAPEAEEVVEEALGLRGGVQGVTPFLQRDTVVGPVTARSCGTTGLTVAGGTPGAPPRESQVPLPVPVLSLWWQQLHLSPRNTPGW